jgi:hypothetical protein
VASRLHDHDRRDVILFSVVPPAPVKEGGVISGCWWVTWCAAIPARSLLATRTGPFGRGALLEKASRSFLSAAAAESRRGEGVKW